jgi:hypothetical protein
LLKFWPKNTEIDMRSPRLPIVFQMKHARNAAKSGRNLCS